VGEPRRTGGRLFYPDSLNLVALDPSGLGLVVVANRAKRACPELTSKALEEHGRLCAHLTAALRLRRRVTSDPSAPGSADVQAGAEAILSPSGQVLHAVGAAVERRAALAEATRRRDRARDGDVLSGWWALHEGRWSLVDSESRDGERVVVATPNAPEASALDRLSERERQVLALLALGRSNKAIAYELGIASSTVATLLSRARWKLGARSIGELVVLAREACGIE
jgi:DNA-binding CsgD family transcriptional regulator